MAEPTASGAACKVIMSDCRGSEHSVHRCAPRRRTVPGYCTVWATASPSMRPGSRGERAAAVKGFAAKIARATGGLPLRHAVPANMRNMIPITSGTSRNPAASRRSQTNFFWPKILRGRPQGRGQSPQTCPNFASLDTRVRSLPPDPHRGSGAAASASRPTRPADGQSCHGHRSSHIPDLQTAA